MQQVVGSVTGTTLDASSGTDPDFVGPEAYTTFKALFKIKNANR